MADPVILISGAVIVGTLVKVYFPGDYHSNLDIHPSYIDEARANIGELTQHTGLKSILNGREERRYKQALENETYRVISKYCRIAGERERALILEYDQWIDSTDRGDSSPEQRL